MSLHSGDNECMIAENAVEVRNVCKSYGLRKNKTKILNSIDLTIKKGAIYGLIGPSGCGKTTLLRVIVRRLLPDFGSVKVFGHSIGSKKSGIPGEGVGYMPQETALYREFTITEILRYFGHIFNMAESDVKQRTDFLLELLQLTNGSAVIKTLSGGQKRRVSFAVSLFQNAPLLILDEPSVGVDPLLRQSIWQHLIKLSEEDNVTVILTSHYIEELKQANVVGLMRNGYLLAEDTPNSLLTKYESTNLEDVFVKLCSQANQTNDRTNSNPDDNFEMIVHENNSKNECCTSNNIQFRPKKKKQIAVKNSKILPGNFLISPNRTKAVVTKNFINLWRSALGFFFQFVTPALQLSIFCLTVGQNPTDLSVGVVNNDVSDLHYGLLFTQSINNDTITLKEYDNIDVAFEAMKKNEIWGLIYMSHNFSSCLLKRFISAGNVADDVLQASKIRIWLDKIDLQIYLPLQMELLEATKKFIHLILEKNNINPSVIDSPVSFETDEIDYKFVESYMVFMTPGVLIV